MEAVLLLTVPDTSLTFNGQTENGSLDLECVTTESNDLYLLFRLNNALEIPIDPTRLITRSDTPAFRSYSFASTQLEPNADILLRIKFQNQNPDLLDTFDSILQQYATQFHPTPAPAPAPAAPSTTKLGVTSGEKDLRGHLVMINQDTGEIIGEVQDNFQIQEDPAMYQSLHQNDPVFIEIDESTRDSDTSAIRAFASLVPPDQQNWITKSASIVSHAISKTTNLLVTTMTSATDYYISHSSPSPHHSGNNSNPTQPPPPPPPPRVLVFLTSDKTRKGLATIHTVSGHAVKISSKTVNTIDGMIRRAMGAKPKRTRYFPTPSGAHQPVVGSSSTSPSAMPAQPPPPPYEVALGSEKSSDKTPPLPPRSPSAPAAAATPLPTVLLPHQPRLTNKDRILISADLLLSTIDDSARRLLDTAPDNVSRIMAHKYGPEAAETSTLLAGTARNVGLVYIDMKGVGRRALLRKAGRSYVKAKFSNK